MKIADILLNEVADELKRLKDFARGHYPDADTEEEALMYFLARSVEHAKKDDNRQDIEIDQLQDKEAMEVNQLAAKIANIEEILSSMRKGSQV